MTETPHSSAAAPRLVCDQCRATYVSSSLESGKAYRCRRCGAMVRYRGGTTSAPPERDSVLDDSAVTFSGLSHAASPDPAEDSDFIRLSEASESSSFPSTSDSEAVRRVDAYAMELSPPADDWLVTGFDHEAPTASIAPDVVTGPPSHTGRAMETPRVQTAAVTLDTTTPPVPVARTPIGTQATATSTRHFARYEIVDEIGRGGMGIVYKARDPGLNRVVAIKTLMGGSAASSGAIKRFEREARSIARLQHPNIVPIYEYGDHEGTRFIVMEFVDGTTLAELTKGERGNLRNSLTLVSKVARALDYAHHQGIVHRDLKPANIMIDRRREPRVMDFGLAKDLDSGQSQLSQTGDLMGTPNYMAPEQADGRIHEVDHLSDVFSLGAILFEMLAGVPPFHGASLAETLRQVLFEDPPPMRTLNPKIDPEVERITLKALEKDREDRYPSAGELADDLDRLLQGQQISIAPPSMATRVARTVKRKRSWVGAAAVGLLVVALGATVTALLLRDPLAGIRERIASRDEEVRLRTIESVATDRRSGRLTEPKHALAIADLVIGSLSDSAIPVRLAAIKGLKEWAPLIAGGDAMRREALARVFEKNLDHDAPTDVRMATLDAIEALHLTEAQEALSFLVSDRREDSTVTLRGVQVLAAVGKLSAFSTLMQVLNRGGAYRIEAQAAIERLTEPKSKNVAVGVPETDKVGLGDLPSAIRGFERDVAGNRSRELAALEDLGMAATPERESETLTRTLKEGPPPRRLAAIYQITERHLPGAPDMLRAALGDPDPAIGQAAASGLVNLLGAGARDELEAELESANPRARAAAAAGLGQLGRGESLPKLYLALANESDIGATTEIARALGNIGDPRAAPHLTARLGDPDPGVRRAAHAALTHLAGHDLGESAAPWQAWAKDQG